MSAAVAYLGDMLVSFSGPDEGTSSDFAARAHLTGLIQGIRTNDPLAFEELLDVMAGPLEAYGRRFTASRDSAKDVVQDVFAHLWEHRATLVVRGSVRGYLYTAVRNRSIDLRRQQQAEALRWTIGDADVPVGMASGSYAADVDVERREIGARVTAALNTLPPRAREAALLRWVDGLSRTEVAAVMGVALGTVKNHLTLAATTIRELLADLRNPA